MAKALTHLPDLPNAGYSTAREREQSDAIMLFMRGVERQRTWLLQIVIGGRDQWYRISHGVWGAFMPKDKIDEMYDYFVLQAGVNPQEQLDTLLLMEKWSPFDRVWKGY